jgi:hypothetical protein
MSESKLPCHLRREVGTTVHLDLECEALHRRQALAPDPQPSSYDLTGLSQAYAGSVCPECGCEEHIAGMRVTSRWDTADGQLHPGDMFWVPALHINGQCSPVHGGWENCIGQHLHVVLPNGHIWNMDSRASNCTRPEDNRHRCWVRHGDPPAITVDKDGITCGAGGGSVKSGDYHGKISSK